jgi:Cu-Zn family superoxide dismutase
MTGINNVFTGLATVILILAVAGCTTGDVGANVNNGDAAEAKLKNAEGEEIGTARFTKAQNGVRLQLEASKLTSGTLALHIHEHGSCEPPTFESAGSHYNPTNATHGFESERGPHLGDLRNISADKGGKVEVYQFASGLSIDGQNSIVGKSLVIHTGPDDYHSQPAGAAGDRLACGVIERD